MPYVLLVAVLLRLAWWWYARPEPVSDFEYYRRSAAALLEHHQFGFPNPSGRAPTYPLFLAGAMLFSRSLTWLSLVNIILSAALVPLSARLAWLLSGSRRGAIATSWIVALSPTFVCFAPVLASEHLFAVLLVAALIVALSGSRDRTWAIRSASAGVLLAAAALARADALFYTPILLTLVWWRSGRRWLAPVTLLLASVVVLTPWYVRNRIVIGPGAGISTAGGVTFYYAHNDRTYGYHPIAGTPLEGLGEAAMQVRGYELGLDYLSRAGWTKVIGDIRHATALQFVPSYPFALVWATQKMGLTPDDLSQRQLAGWNALYRFSQLFWHALLIGAAFSLVFVRRLARTAALVLFGIISLNWLGHCVMFLGEGRYRYPAELACCVVVGIVVGQTFRSAEPRQT